MQVAVLYDIHSNLPALEAVLDQVRLSGAERIVIGGDVFPGPMPRETIKRLLSLDLPIEFIHGNADREVLNRMQGRESSEVPERFRPALGWVAEQLHPEYDYLIASWPLTRQLTIQGLGNVLFCHATPRSDNQLFSRLTPENLLIPIFDGLGASVVVCGHTHMQFDRMVGKTRVVNAGSVGAPNARTGAFWLLLGPVVQHQHTSYDLTKAADRILATKYPLAQDFARSILEPLSEKEVLADISKMELREANALKTSS